jgi:hypothetical protein
MPGELNGGKACFANCAYMGSGRSRGGYRIWLAAETEFKKAPHTSTRSEEAGK